MQIGFNVCGVGLGVIKTPVQIGNAAHTEFACECIFQVRFKITEGVQHLCLLSCGEHGKGAGGMFGVWGEVRSHKGHEHPMRKLHAFLQEARQGVMKACV